jgi:nucleoside-diphosphate-sugar epimerase
MLCGLRRVSYCDSRDEPAPVSRRYFCTGCTGWIGSAIVTELLRRPDTEHICLLSRAPRHSGHSKVSYWQGDICDDPLPVGAYTHVIHGANDSHFAEPMRCFYSIVEGTRRLVAWAEEHNIGDILCLSSGAVHRDTVYGRGKLIAEGLLPYRAKVARLYTFIGNDTPMNYAIGAFISQAMTVGKVTVRGGENVTRSYLHLDDAAKWLLKILDDGYHGVRYDVGGDSPWNVRSVAMAVANVFGVPLEAESASELPDAYLPDVRETKRLGLKSTINLITALERIRDHSRLRNPDLESA